VARNGQRNAIESYNGAGSWQYAAYQSEAEIINQSISAMKTSKMAAAAKKAKKRRRRGETEIMAGVK
jgi:hypothetical protein